MEGYPFVHNISRNRCPDYVVYLLGRKLVEDTVGASQDVVQLFASFFLVVYVWITNYNIWISAKSLLFGLEISESSANG
jgi:hypothetical protein